MRHTFAPLIIVVLLAAACGVPSASDTVGDEHRRTTTPSPGVLVADKDHPPAEGPWPELDEGPPPMPLPDGELPPEDPARWFHTTAVDPTHRLQKEYAYDANGNVRQRKSGGAVEERRYDRGDRLVGVDIPTPAGVLSYNLFRQDDGQVANTQDARGIRTVIGVNAIAQQHTESSPDRGNISRQFDTKGRLTGESDARGNTIVYGYDDANRMRSVSENGAVTTTFEFGPLDGVAVPFGDNRLTRVRDAAGETTFQYDGFGHITQKLTRSNQGESFATGYSYGQSGPATNKLTAVRYPSGVRVDYGYNASGRVDSIVAYPPTADGTSNDLAAGFGIASGIAFTPSGEVERFTFGDGLPYARTWNHDGDKVGLLKSYPIGAITRALDYDPRGNITAFAHSGTADAATLDRSFAYDERNQLTAVTGNGSYVYGYDPSGNRTLTTINGIALSSSYPVDSNKLSSSQELVGGAVQTFDWPRDAAGNPTNVRGIGMSYDARGRLSQTTYPEGGSAQFYYDADGYRVVEVGARVPGGRLQRVYSLTGQLLGEYAAGQPLYEVIWMGDLPVGVIRKINGAMEISYVFADHLHTPVQVIQPFSHTPRWSYDSFDAFGSAAPNNNPAGLGEFIFNLRFEGQVYSASTGVFYNHHRDYDPVQGRYLTVDPLGVAGGLNTFAYAGGAPTRLTDPDGLFVPLAYAAAAVVGLGILTLAAMVQKAKPMSNFEQGLLACTGPPKCKPPSDKLEGKELDKYMAGDMPEKWYEYALRQKDYNAYKATCNRSAPKGISKCEQARWERHRNLQCIKRRQSWEDHWGNEHTAQAHQEMISKYRDAVRLNGYQIMNYCLCGD